MHYDIDAKAKGLYTGKQVTIPLAAYNDSAYCSSNHVTYKEAGLVPLSTLAQCYGLFLAMAESIMPIAKYYGQVTVCAYPYKNGDKFGITGDIKITVANKLSQW